MGKSGKNSKSAKFQLKSGSSTRSSATNKKQKFKVNKSIKGDDGFNRRLLSLAERTNKTSLGSKKKNVQRKMIIPEKAVFSYSNVSQTETEINKLEEEKQPTSTSLINELLREEKDVKTSNIGQKSKKSSCLHFSNRFELLENDEILEDGTHSILKMNLKSATFSLPTSTSF